MTDWRIIGITYAVGVMLLTVMAFVLWFSLNVMAYWPLHFQIVAIVLCLPALIVGLQWLNERLR